MIYFFIQSLIFCAFSAPHPVTQPIPEWVLSSLRQPQSIAVGHLKAEKKLSYAPLKQIAFDEKIPLKTRWKSLMLLSEVYGLESLNELQSAVDHKSWFMRSAGLTALNSIDAKIAQKWALVKLKSDPSLLVRMKALEILKDSTDQNVRDLMWQKVHSRDSFHQNRGLWIRQDVARVLLQNTQSQEFNKWIKLLHDQEPVLKEIAVLALKKIKSNDWDPKTDLSRLQKMYPLEKSI